MSAFLVAAALLCCLPLSAAAGFRPQLLSGGDSGLVMVILMIASPYLLAPLFSAIYLFTRRDACKWAAIIFTVILAAEDMFLGDLSREITGLIPAASFAMIATKLWMRATPRFYVALSALWSLTALELMGTLFGVAMTPLYAFAGYGYAWVILWNILAGAVIVLFGIRILGGAARRRMQLPRLPEFAGYGVLLVLLDFAWERTHNLLRFYIGSHMHSGQYSILPNYTYIVIQAMVAGAAAIIAWLWYQRRPVDAPFDGPEAGVDE